MTQAIIQNFHVNMIVFSISIIDTSNLQLQFSNIEIKAFMCYFLYCSIFHLVDFAY